MNWSLTEPTSFTAVVEADTIMLHGRIPDRTLVTDMRNAAERQVENELGLALLTQTLVLKLDAFPSYAILLPKPPLQSITSIAYVDTDGNSQTLSSSLYTTQTEGYGHAVTAPGHVRPVWNGSWPSTRGQPMAVTITYVAGWTAASLIPDPIKAMIRIVATDLYENRERTTGQPFLFQSNPTVEALAANYRSMWEPDYGPEYDKWAGMYGALHPQY